MKIHVCVVFRFPQRFYTAQAFKGLEAQVVIYLDIEGFKSNDERMLNYVAMSRARTLLEVFYDQSLEKDRQEMMINAATMQSV